MVQERKKRDDEARREEMELDYLAPFLARIGKIWLWLRLAALSYLLF